MKKLNLITPENMPPRIVHEGITYTATGRAYMQTVDGKFYIEVNRSKVGANGHVTISANGRTVYLARMIYCLFVLNYGKAYTDLPKTGKLKYLDGDYSNCAVENLQLVPRRATEKREPVEKIDVWGVRVGYCEGKTYHELAGTYDVSEAYIRGLVRGFDGVSAEKVRGMIG